jgi:hydroxymethylpyrimidine/phosphomethylpyrimidine kinase / thiaminase
MVEHIHHEMALHVDYCKGFGITKAEMEASEESQGMFVLTNTIGANQEL